MSQPSSPVPHEVKESLIRLTLLYQHEQVVNTAGLKAAVNIIEGLSSIDPEGISSPIHGLPVYSGPNPVSATVQEAVAQRCTLELLQLLGHMLRCDEALMAKVDAILEAEIVEKYKKIVAPDCSTVAKAKMIAKARYDEEKAAQALKSSNTSLNSADGYDFRLKLSNFNTHLPTYTYNTTLHYKFGVNFQQLTADLQQWTSPRVIPPPLPIYRDPNYEYPPQLEYSNEVFNRLVGKRGYTIEDGPWYFSIFEGRLVQETSKWQRISTGKLYKEEDFVGMIAEMQKGLGKRTFNSFRFLSMIHSQDQIALWRWQHHDHYQKLQAEVDDAIWEEKDGQMIDEFLGITPSNPLGQAPAA